MKNLSIVFAMAVAFMLFSAQNCQKRDPITETGSLNNPTVIGIPSVNQGAIDLYLLNSGTKVANNPIGVALTAADLKNKNYFMTLTSNDSFVKVRNVFAGRTYYFHADYLDPAKTPKACDTFISAGSRDLPSTLNMELK